jgi:asparagine synthase (glutamine-hydrolysing)
MCGIAGYLNLTGAPADGGTVMAMRDALAHRGPDGAGVHVDGALGFGHRRLSIIDLRVVANQPMQCSSKEVR